MIVQLIAIVQIVIQQYRGYNTKLIEKKLDYKILLDPLNILSLRMQFLFLSLNDQLDHTTLRTLIPTPLFFLHYLCINPMFNFYHMQKYNKL